ncbi:DUF2971 domain-containing protein [Candidatus Poribacteria bacterium]|nr:DUF2971 domain-containing protein [Candidatus Poribacteria bacterium]
MAEFFRFRSINSLLVEHQELEKQTIYFASPEELNDPMEGFRDIVWSGDKIVWTNFFKHYVYCLYLSYFQFRLVGDSKTLEIDSIPILGCWDQLPSPQAQNLFDEIWHNFLNVPNIQEIIEALANTKHKIRYREIGYYLRIIYPVLLKEIIKSYITHGLLPKSEMPELPEELPLSAFLAAILFTLKLTEEAKTEKELDDAFLFSEMMDNNERFKEQYNSRPISTDILRKNNQLVIFDFPKVYVEQLERLLWPEWYTTCFMKSYHNSSMWGNYGDNHKGICLIFEGVETDNLNSLELNLAANGGTRTIPFREVTYADRPSEIDFFRTICRLPIAALRKLWYTDREGKISECAAHIGPDRDEDTWRKKYWNKFFRDITIKTKDWAYEQEYRLILEDGLSEFNKRSDRTLTYDFNSLKGIIFGIRTSDEDKRKIIEIIEKKCEKYNRADFKFFQADYSAENGNIRKYPIQLPFAKDTDR